MAIRSWSCNGDVQAAIVKAANRAAQFGTRFRNIIVQRPTSTEMRRGVPRLMKWSGAAGQRGRLLQARMCREQNWLKKLELLSF
jgi:hypothetical protein